MKVSIKNAPISFFEYMEKHHINDNTPVGDFARDISRDSGFPRDNVLKREIKNSIMDRYGFIHSAVLDALDESWKLYTEFLLELKERSNS